MTDYEDPFLKHRRAQEQKHLERIGDDKDPMASLISVEMNITELCNRTCVFCPRVDPEVYPNQNLMMDLKISKKVSTDLASLGYKGRISFSGFGESLLNKDFHKHIRIFHEALPDNTIETNTNGDPLSVELIRVLYDAGINAIYVNLYDGPEQVFTFQQMFKKAGIEKERYHLREHWQGAEGNFGLTMNNRSGMVKNKDIGLESPQKPLHNRCHYPFYKMFVDWNGDVLFCANDWGREIIVDNVLKKHVKDIWMSKQMLEIRRFLANGDRSFSPCNKCNVQGTLHGQYSFDLLVSTYRNENTLGFDECP